ARGPLSTDPERHRGARIGPFRGAPPVPQNFLDLVSNTNTHAARTRTDTQEHARGPPVEESNLRDLGLPRPSGGAGIYNLARVTGVPIGPIRRGDDLALSGRGQPGHTIPERTRRVSSFLLMLVEIPPDTRPRTRSYI